MKEYKYKVFLDGNYKVEDDSDNLNIISTIISFYATIDLTKEEEKRNIKASLYLKGLWNLAELI